LGTPPLRNRMALRGRGGVYNKETPLEFASAGTGLNSYVYVPGRDPREAQGAGAPRITVEEPGPLVATLRIDSDAPGARSLVRRVTLVAGEENVEIEDVLDKVAVRAKESAHIAFPFNLPKPSVGGDTGPPSVCVDEGGALVMPGDNQIAGSCRDFIGAHSGVDVWNSNSGIALVTLDAPLVEIGAITDERQDPESRVRKWPRDTAPGTAAYAYLLNNYWHTNYKADQEGRLRFRFVLRPHSGSTPLHMTGPGGPHIDLTFAALAFRQFSAGYEQPLLARPVTVRTPILRAPFRLEGSGAVSTSIRSDGASGGLLVRLYNASEAEAVARLVAIRGGSPIRVQVVDGAGKVTPVPKGELRMRPFATAIVRVTVSSR